MSFLLDTNVLSELRKQKRAHPHVYNWATTVGWSAFHTSWIVIAEMRRGANLARRHDVAQATFLDAWIAEVIERLENRIFQVDRPVAEVWATLMVPDPRSPLDALIAATALARRLTLVTRNTRDFEGSGIALLDPWEFAV